jgi:hypothetical protein
MRICSVSGALSEKFPAASTTRARTTKVPSGRADGNCTKNDPSDWTTIGDWPGVGVMTPPAGTPGRTTLAETRTSWTFRPGVARPCRRGCRLLVMLSPTAPVSSAATMLRVGTVGVVSMTRIVRGADGWLGLPARSTVRTRRA